ncbi:hypothetical protein [Mesorhizobium silamurunense]|uniref:hypothetical protein n=1 Tax=Mesorhizobium silamurunense TaxID=499528 RepID=UPI00177E11C0|nr:hypothetical protein [Mesorhizobium silamurunense]
MAGVSGWSIEAIPKNARKGFPLQQLREAAATARSAQCPLYVLRNSYGNRSAISWNCFLSFTQFRMENRYALFLELLLKELAARAAGSRSITAHAWAWG